MGSIGIIAGQASRAIRATSSEANPNSLMAEVYNGAQAAVYGSDGRMLPQCSHLCDCFNIATAHHKEQTTKLYGQLIIAFHMLCDERGLPRNNENTNAILSEVHDQWVTGLNKQT
jgi:hypothetical protein